ncbi:hypothetical protein VE02_08566 [Pseudogymnoascus sp. 03VT05]|nr:hypothetical protein VE02_08566 [Pseudogymnoascus sp. 03VT05]
MNGPVTASSLDAADYDPIDDLNTIFSHPSTLSSVGAVGAALQTRQDALDTSINALTGTLAAPRASSSLDRMSSAKTELDQLFRKIESVRNRALETEHTITNMTADIKRLDHTKRNLTLSMTALKRLQMLTTAYEQLRGLAKSRQYRECAGLLQAVLQLMAHFRSYRSIDQIATLSRNVADLQRELGEQVCEDFEMAFAKGEVGGKRGMLKEACLVMDALGDTARARLITWYCNTMLREYRQVFRGNDEAGSLDNIGRRYSWFKRMWKTYDDEHAAIFPLSWRVNEMLANAFCEGTREDYKAILEKSTRRTDGNTLDVSLLLRCLQETLDFEHSLEAKFASDPRASLDTLNSEERAHTFDGSISQAFEPYLSLWVESRDKQLASMIPTYRNQPPLAEDEEFHAHSVLASSIELFHFYKVTLAQCAKLSTSDRLLDLSRTFAKYLDEYAHAVLLPMLSRSSPAPPHLNDAILVLNTADYWHTNSTQLADTLRRRIDAELAPKVDFAPQADTFMGVASAALVALARRVDAAAEPAWREMRNTNWSRMESVGDQSSYVGELVRRVEASAGETLALLQKQGYARAFADKVVEGVVQAYVGTIVACRPISEVGAEQLLLDKYVLTSSLTSLLPPNPSFQKRVATSLARLDPLLKTLQVRPSPPEALVQAYLIHIHDRSDANFRKVLDLKGVRRSEVGSLIELFGVHRASAKDDEQGGGLVDVDPFLGGLSLVAVQAAPNAQAAAAAAFGEKILGVAREGVGIGEGEVEGNLRGIGKFFRRDISAFGGRFGMGEGK